jgi:hypothetical protein
MAAGFYDLLAWMLGWQSAVTPEVTPNMFFVEAGYISAAGGRAGGVFVGGAEKGHVSI